MSPKSIHVQLQNTVNRHTDATTLMIVKMIGKPRPGVTLGPAQHLEDAMRMWSIALVSAALAGSLAAQQTPPKTTLKPGDMAPDFTLPSTSGKPVKLSDFRGKSAVVLAFFPAAFTGGCTKEMLAYQASLAKFEGAETQVFGISADNTPSQKKFAEELKLAFPLLSDFAKREVSAAYGVLMPDRGFANRATFVIDKEGRIQHIEEGSTAIDPTGAETACSRIRHGAE